MNEKNISAELFATKCSRKGVKTPGDFTCDSKCMSVLGNPTQTVQAVLKLRRRIWIDPDDDTNPVPAGVKAGSGRDIKNMHLTHMLLEMWSGMQFKFAIDGLPVMVFEMCSGQEFKFAIDGMPVCKEFFKRATGIGRDSVNALLYYVRYGKDCRGSKIIHNYIRKGWGTKYVG